MAKKLTVKEAKLVKAKAEGKTHAEAYVEAGYAPTTDKGMRVNASRVLAKPHVKATLAELMDEQGLGDNTLLQTLKEGLQASKTIVMGKDSGESFVDIQPDHAVRHKFLETGLRLRGHGTKSDGQGGTIIFNQGHVVQKYVKD